MIIKSYNESTIQYHDLKETLRLTVIRTSTILDLHSHINFKPNPRAI